MPTKYIAADAIKRKEEQEDLKATVESKLTALTQDMVQYNNDLAERANVAKQELADEMLTLKAELRRSIHAETTLKKRTRSWQPSLRSCKPWWTISPRQQSS
jgi:predicted YcjX-like family ATPase